ncbi:hypothetical protein PS906_04715 [Pseudomonas fluorescens]|nr:hypothetical protein PS906_04715 [Pseudomonas fluorescens]
MRSAVDLAVDAAAVGRQLQEGRFVQQGFEVQRRLLTDQLHLEHKRLADGFPAGQGKHLEISGKTFDGQGKVGFIGRREHPLFLVLCSGARRRPQKRVNVR